MTLPTALYLLYQHPWHKCIQQNGCTKICGTCYKTANYALHHSQTQHCTDFSALKNWTNNYNIITR